MKINLQAKNMELTPAIHDYVIKRITNLGKLLSKIEEASGEEVLVHFSVAKTTNHHKMGKIFQADCSVLIKRENFHSSVDEEDLYQAIDAVKENLFGEIAKNKNKKNAFFYRGARKIKDLMKGIRNWRK